MALVLQDLSHRIKLAFNNVLGKVLFGMFSQMDDLTNAGPSKSLFDGAVFNRIIFHYRVICDVFASD